MTISLSFLVENVFRIIVYFIGIPIQILIFVGFPHTELGVPG